MVLRLKTRESRSLPGLPSASVTLLFTIFVSSTLNLIVAETRPPIADAFGGFEFLGGRAARDTSQTADPGPRGEPAADAAPHGPASHFPPPRPGRDGRRIQSGSQGQNSPPKPESLTAGWSSPVARQAHNLKVVSSNLAPATISNCDTKSRTSAALTGRLFCVRKF